jgi:hypothetical protein
MSEDDKILTPGVRRNLAELYVSGMAQKDAAKYNGFFLLIVNFENGQQGNYLFNPNLKHVLTSYAKPNLEPINPIKVLGYKIDRVGGEIAAHLTDAEKKETDVMRAKVLPTTS